MNKESLLHTLRSLGVVTLTIPFDAGTEYVVGAMEVEGLSDSIENLTIPGDDDLSLDEYLLGAAYELLSEARADWADVGAIGDICVRPGENTITIVMTCVTATRKIYSLLP